MQYVFLSRDPIGIQLEPGIQLLCAVINNLTDETINQNEHNMQYNILICLASWPWFKFEFGGRNYFLIPIFRSGHVSVD